MVIDTPLRVMNLHLRAPLPYSDMPLADDSLPPLDRETVMILSIKKSTIGDSLATQPNNHVEVTVVRAGVATEAEQGPPDFSIPEGNYLFAQVEGPLPAPTIRRRLRELVAKGTQGVQTIYYRVLPEDGRVAVQFIVPVQDPS